MAERKVSIEKLKLKDILQEISGKKDKGKAQPLKLVKLSSRPEIKTERS